MIKEAFTKEEFSGGIHAMNSSGGYLYDAFPVVWNLLNRIIAQFKTKYDSLQQTAIQIDHRLKAAALFEAGEGLYHGVFRLEFRTSSDSDNAHSSSVYIQMPSLGLLYEEGRELRLYDKEKYMYEQILPGMHKIIWPVENFSPLCYVSTDSGILVVENLRESGFYSVERASTEYSLCETVFTSLAHFHALSRLYLDGSPNVAVSLVLFNVVDRSANTVNSPTFHAICRKFRTRLTPSLPSHLQAQFENMVREARTLVQLTHSVQPDSFNCILQGSANRANIFFSTAADSPTCKFVNFQNSRPGSPVIDLISYLISGVEFELFQTHQDALFNKYVEELNAVLAVSSRYSSSPAYSLDELRADLKKFKLYFVYELVFKAPMYWTTYATVRTDGVEDEYDHLLGNEKFVSFFINWMEVFSSW